MEKLYAFAQRLNRLMQRAEMIIGCVCLACLVGLMLFNAGARYLFDFPVIWSDEMNNFLFIWMSFMSCAYIMGNDGHMRVTAVLNFLSPGARYWVGMFTNLVMLVAFAWFIPAFWRLLDMVTFSGLMRLPLKYVYFILPLSFGLMCIHIILNMIKSTCRYKGGVDTKEANA